MDALALLCNLYGDGPATLKRLRAHGVVRIEDLAGRDAGDLANSLALTPSTARRFLREAAALEKRVIDVGHSDESDALESTVAVRAPREVLRGKEALLAAATRRWTELDRAAPVAEATSAPRNATGARAPAATEDAPALEPLEISLWAVGLDPTTRDALACAGVRSAEDLTGRDSEALALSSGLGISQVLFAQGLARRSMRGHGGSAQAHLSESESEELPVRLLQPKARTDPRFSPTERAPDGWLSAGRPMDDVSADVIRADSGAPDEGAGPFA